METQSQVKPVGISRLSVMKWLAAASCLLGVSFASAAPLTINVVGVGSNGQPTGAPVADYRWTVEEDATKLSIPGQPATAANYSFSFHTSYMPVVAAGRVGTEKAGVTQDPDVARLYAQNPPEVCPATNSAPCLSPAKRYYVSVAADGFQMGGAPVVFDSTGASATVYVNQYALPTAQVSVFAFNDNNPINGAPDLPVETGLAGFTVQLFEAGGTYGQSGGAVTQDGFGNPLGTTYSDDQGTVLKKGAGIVLTGPDGTATIKNLFPAKYTVVIVPPVNSDWHQTSTIEGTRGSDAWVKNNEPSFFQEFGPPGHHVFIGFTRSGCVQGPATGNNSANRCQGLQGPNGISAAAVTDRAPHAITGRVINIHNSRTPNYAFEKGAPVPECWVGLNQTGGGTSALYATACAKDSTFKIPNVPNGTYELVVWDDPLDMIIGTQTITVLDGDLAMGDVPVFSWFGRYQGRVFQDINGTGLPFFKENYNKPYIKVDPVTGIESEGTKTFAAGELKPAFGEGIANNIRFRDGSIYQSAVTKQDGTFAFTELFPFFNWMIAEIDYARFKATGATMIADAGGAIDPALNETNLWKAEAGSYGSNDPAYAYNPWIRLNPQQQPDTGLYYRNENCDETGGQCATLLEGMQTFLGQTNHIEWGKQPYAGVLNGPKNENGGIAGIVHYAITRAEDDPRFAAAENWEPGIPRVQVNMYLDCDGDGKPDQPLNDGSGQCSALSSAGYVYVQADVDNYPFCWRDPQESCGLETSVKGPEDFTRSSDTPNSTYSYGDVFRWGAPRKLASEQLHTGLGTTDSWDDNIPTGCVKPAAGGVGNGGIPVTPTLKDTLDCFDGLYNFNQLRPSVFDGGYAFGRVAGQAELPVFIGLEGKGTYIIEAVAPPGYLHQGNGDKNVVFGDALAASTAALPFECVGMSLPVPPTLTLFPGESNPNYTGPTQTWNKCDMKAVPLVPGTNPAPDFYMFTEAPVAGHGVGFILDDTATEFNRFSPTFGEKYAPPHLPISIQDWTGRELSRAYSDQFGSYNFLVPSSFTINPPFPSGVMPSMMVSCMNHPGPITDERVNLGLDANGNAIPNPTFGQKIIDPFFNRKYTQFCYTLQYLPGKTTYLDTPVLPIAAFANVEKNPLDCECQDKTPAIYSVNSGGNFGPWVNSATGGTLTVVSAGSNVQVPNPAYDPAVIGSPKLIMRDYSFGATPGKVYLGNQLLTVSSWTSDLLLVAVPAHTPSGQLNIIRGDNGKETVVGLTVHVDEREPKVVATGGSIQAVIDAADTVAGDLITIPPGTYNEYLILDKRVRLQGWGAGSVTINASKASAGGLAAWRKLLNTKVDARCGTLNGLKDTANCPPGTPIDPDTGAPTVVAGVNRTFDPLPGQTLGIAKGNNEPILFGAEEGAGILAVGKAFPINGDPLNATSCVGDASNDYRIDGLSVTGSDSGGGILASGYNCHLNVTNNRVVSNYGTYGGGIRVGHTALTNADAFTNGLNNDVKIDHNWVSQNGASEIASGDGGGGGITMGTGSNSYVVQNNYICGNFSMSDGGGISHVGLSAGTNSILNNKIVLNQTFNQSADPTGGGLFIGGQIPVGGGASDGTGNVNVDRNLIQYNHAGAGAGGGVSIARTRDTDLVKQNIVLTNNMIVNNATAYAGGGVAVADVTSSVRLVNNTVADNISTATNRQSFTRVPVNKDLSAPQVAGIARVSGPSNSPTLLNNIVLNNKSFVWSINRAVPETTTLTPAVFTTGLASAVWDLGVVGRSSHALLTATNSVLTASAGNRTGGVSTNLAATASQIAFVKPITFLPQTDSDQPGVLPETTIMQTALTFDEGGNFINVNFSPLTPWDLTAGATFGSLRADYHIKVGSVAINAGASRSDSNGVPDHDYDGDARSVSLVDIGADELGSTDLAITKTDGLTTVTPGQQVTYTIVVTNNGTTSVAGATVNDPAVLGQRVTPNSWACVASPGSTCPTSGTGAISNVAIDLASGGTATFTLLATVSPTATGCSMVSNTASVTAPAGIADSSMANNSATDTDQITCSTADLSITKTVGAPTAVANGTVVYTVTVTNNGPDAATGARVTDTVPTAYTQVTNGWRWTCSATPIAMCGAGANAGIGNINKLLGTLPANATVTFTIRAIVRDDNAVGTLITNTARVVPPVTVSDPNPGNNTASVTVTVVGTGVADSALPANIAFGTVVRGNQSATSDVTVTNTGTSTLAIADIVRGGAVPTAYLVVAPSTGTACIANTTVLAPAASCTIGVRFAPTIANTRGAKAATLTVTSNATAKAVALSGTAN